MLKNLIIIIALMGLFSCGKKEESLPAQALKAAAIPTVCARGNNNPELPDGCYLLSGALSLKVSAPKVLNVNASAPHMELFKVKAVFLPPSGATDNLVVILPPLTSGAAETEMKGTWQTGLKPKTFTAEVSSLNDLKNLGFGVQITKHVFTGSLQDNGNIKGSINLGAKIIGIGSFSIISSAYGGQPTSTETAAAMAQTGLADEVFTLEGAAGILPPAFQQLIQTVRDQRSAP